MVVNVREVEREWSFDIPLALLLLLLSPLWVAKLLELVSSWWLVTWSDDGSVTPSISIRRWRMR